MYMKKVVFSTLLLLVSVTIGVPCVLGVDVVEIYTCDDVDTDTRELLGSSSIFLTYANDVYVWVSLSGIQSGQTLRFMWSSPGGVIFAENEVTLFPTYTKYWDSISVNDNWPEQNPGVWRVEIYIDDELKTFTTFELINYDAIILEKEIHLIIIDSLNDTISDLTESYLSIQDDLEGLNTEIDALSKDYSDLNLEYHDLQGRYNETYNDLQELMVNYNTIQDDYASISEEYQSNSEELSDTKKALNNTRTLLYASSGLALILLIASVYLVYTGRRS